MKKKITIIVIIIAVLAAGWMVWSFLPRGKGGPGSGTMVRLDHPEKGVLVEYVNAPGRIEPREKVDIRSRISAKIVDLLHEEGDWVVKGDPSQDPPVAASVLMELDSKDVTAQLDAAQIRRRARAARITATEAQLVGQKAGVEGQRSVLTQAERELHRKKSLLSSRDISQSAVDQQQSAVDNMRAQLKASEEGFKAAELNLTASRRDLEAADADIDQVVERVEYTRITAPMDGTIIKLNVEVGEMATGSQYNPGNVLATVADLSKMILVARVDETDIALVKEGQSAKVYIHAWPDRVFEGEVVAFVGPTGAGKTSLAYMIPAFLRATEGEVLIDGIKVEDYALDSLRREVTYVFQEHLLLSESIRDNIRFGKPDATEQDIMAALDAAGCTEFVDKLPEGIDTVLGRSGDTLSVGQQQRLSIARGLVRDSRILILDEPTAALDPQTENALVRALHSASADRLVIIIAHRLSTIRRANRIVFLEDGEVKDVGSHDALMEDPASPYRRFVELQGG